MRNQLLDVLRYTWYNGLFEFLNIYHIKDIATEIIPDLYGKIIEIDPRTSQLVTTKADTPWLELGLPVRFATTPDGSSQALNQATLDPTKTYYIHSITGESHCFRFTVAESPVSSEFIELPYANFEFTMIHDRSYIVVKDPSFLDLNMKIVFEPLPNTQSDLADSPLSALTKYYVDSFWPGNKIRINASQNASDYIHFSTAWTGEIEIVQDNTFIEASSIDQKLHVSASTDEKIAALHGTFGMDNLGKLWEELLNTKDYPDPSDNILVEDSNANNEFVSTKFYFASSDKKFKDEYPLIHKDEVPPMHHVWQDARATEWNMTLTTDEDTIRRYQLMYKTYDEFAFFDLWTNKVTTTHSAAPALPHYELELEFGMDNPKKGNLIMIPDIYGTYIPRIIYEFNTTAEPIAYYSGTIARVSAPKRYVCELLQKETGTFRIDDTSRLRVGMSIRFENPPDSAQALGQLGLKHRTDYFVREIIDCEKFKVGVTNDSPLSLDREEDNEVVKRKDYYTVWYFYLLVNDHCLEMEDVIEPKPTTHESRKLLHYIKPGMKIRFENSDDSAQALTEATLDDTDYYIKEVFDSRPVLRDASNKVPIWLNPNTGDPIEDFLDRDARYPDKSNRPVVTEETTLITRFTISKTLGGPTLELPFCNFEFKVFHDVDEIHVDDTRWFAYRQNQPIKFANKAGLSGVQEAGLSTKMTYYVHSIINENRLKIKTTQSTTNFFEFNHTTTKCMQHHNTGKGLLWTSYPAIASPDTDGKEVQIYSRPNVFFSDLDSVPMDGPYKFTFGTVTCEITHDSIWGPYYSATTDYTIGRGKTS